MSNTVTEPASNTPPRSFLIADCGTTNTTVALFDEAAGSYRLIARATTPTTAGEPWDDIHQGIKQAIQQISAITGRSLLNKRGDLIRPARISGRGVDAFAAVASAAPPLNTLIAGLFDKVSLASARRILKSTYSRELDTFNLADSRSESEQVTSIINHQPDIILIVGGTDGGAEESLISLIETIQISTQVLSEAQAPHILFAGNKNLRAKAREILGGKVHFHVADNVRPTLGSENLASAANLINELYEGLKIRALPGIQEIRQWSNQPLQPTAQALATITNYLAALQKGRVVAVDLGSNSVTFVEAFPDKPYHLWVHTDLGMGHPITNLLDNVSLNDIIRWIPEPIEEEKVRDFIYNKGLHPHTIPNINLELQIEQAAAREILRSVIQENSIGKSKNEPKSPLRLLLARGKSLTASPRPSQTMLMLLDTLQPTGIFSVAIDTYGVLPALGNLAAQEPLAAVQALEGGALENLGWVVVPTGKGKPGQKVLSVVLESEQTQRLEVEVEYGTIEVLPLAPGQSAKVTLQPSRRFDIGFGPGKKQKITVHGGAVGLVIDARGRPLSLPSDDVERQEILRQWHWDIGG